MPKPSLSGHVCHCSTYTGWYSGTVVSTSIGSPWSVKLRANSASAEHKWRIFFHALRERESAAGKTFCNDGTKLHGAIEGDGHAVRKIYAGHENKHFVSEVQAAHQNWRKKHGSKCLPKYMNLPKRSSPEKTLALLSPARSALIGGGKVYKMPFQIPRASKTDRGEGLLTNWRLMCMPLCGEVIWGTRQTWPWS